MVLVQQLVSGDRPCLYIEAVTQPQWSRPITWEQPHLNKAHYQLLQPDTQLKEYLTLVFTPENAS